MDPYRAPHDPGELPPVPLRYVLWPVATICALLVCLVAGKLGTRETPRPTPPAIFDVAQLNGLDADALAALRGQVVTVRGVVRERRRDSFLSWYVVLGQDAGTGGPFVQCFLADGGASTPPAGTAGRFRARILGESLGVLVQAEDCALLGE